VAVPDVELAVALRALLRLNIGVYVCFCEMVEIGQLENLNYWVESRKTDGTVLWEIDDIPLEEAIAHFLRIRSERQAGYDIEADLTSKNDEIA